MRQPISRSISDREKNTNGAYPHWVVLVIVTFLTLHVIAEPIIVFSITKKWYSLAPATDLLPISYAGKHMLLYFFPKEPQDYELEKEKNMGESLGSIVVYRSAAKKCSDELELQA